MTVAAGLTIDDFERLPDGLALNRELVAGELVDVSGNTFDHNRLRDLLVRVLSEHVETRRLGAVVSEQEYQFGSNAHGPDVSFIGPERLPLIASNYRVQRFTPNLAIEIASPNDCLETLFKKVERYRQHGVEEVWLFSIETRKAWVLSDARSEMLGPEAMFNPAPLSGFQIAIGELFDRTPFQKLP